MANKKFSAFDAPTDFEAADEVVGWRPSAPSDKNKRWSGTKILAFINASLAASFAAKADAAATTAALAAKADAAATTAALAAKADAAATTAALDLKANKADCWQRVGGSNVAITHTGAAGVETTLVTCSIPAGAMGPNGMMRVTMLTSAAANNANAKTFRLRFGGSAFQLWSLASTLSNEMQRIIRNRNSASSQVSQTAGAQSSGSVNAAVSTMAINTAAAFDVTITCNLAVGTDSVNIESWLVEILYGA
jgi:hypothetical protein